MGFLGIPSYGFAQTQEELTAQLKGIEAQIKAYEAELANTHTEKDTLHRKLTQLKKEQTRITLLIKATNVKIATLKKDLATKQEALKRTETRLARLQRQTSLLLGNLYRERQTSFMEVLLSSHAFSALLERVAGVEDLARRVFSLAQEAKATQKTLEVERTGIQKKKTEQQHLLEVQTLQHNSLTDKTQEQQQLLSATKGKEELYQVLQTFLKPQEGAHG